MKDDRPPPDDLVTLLRAAEEGARPGPDCPDPTTLWAAARGTVDSKEVRRIVAHTAICATCSSDWRLAATLAHEAGLPEATGARRRIVTVAWAAAATLVLATGLWFTSPWWQPESLVPGAEYRDEPDAGGILTGVADDSVLSRNEFLLTWTEGPAGTKYIVEVMTEDLRTLHISSDLDTARFLVPPEALARVPNLSRVLWRVEATMPDGRVELSPTFVARVGGLP